MPFKTMNVVPNSNTVMSNKQKTHENTFILNLFYDFFKINYC